MITIHKFELKVLPEVQNLKVRKKAKLLKCANQFENLVLWFEVDTYEDWEHLNFITLTTGQGLPEDLYSRMHFIETVQFDGGNFVLHIYQIQ